MTPIESRAAEGRAAERYRLARLGALANVAARAAAMVLMVLTVHLASPYLGTERFGVWATFASLAAMLSFLDLGVGNALINRVAHHRASDGAETLSDMISGGFGWLAVVGFSMAILLVGIASLIPWPALFKLSDPVVGQEARLAAIAFSALFGLNLFTSGLQKILIGLQRSHEAHAISMCGALGACAAVWWASRHQAGVPELLVAGFGVQSVVGLTTIALLRSRGWLRWYQLPAAMAGERKALLRTGSLFLVLQIGTMIGWGSDSLLLASLGGASQVASFAVVQRLFQFASQPVAVLNAPLWAAYADARAFDDRAFIRRTLVRSARWSLLAGTTLTVMLCALGPWLIPHWTQGSLSAPMGLIALFATWTILEIAGTVFGAYLNGAGIVREQVVVVLVFCAVAVPLKVWATLQAGAAGLVAATITAYLVTVVGLYATVYRHRVLEPLRNTAR